jgi:hypothetical protein
MDIFLGPIVMAWKAVTLACGAPGHYRAVRAFHRFVRSLAVDFEDVVQQADADACCTYYDERWFANAIAAACYLRRRIEAAQACPSWGNSLLSSNNGGERLQLGAQEDILHSHVLSRVSTFSSRAIDQYLPNIVRREGDAAAGREAPRRPDSKTCVKGRARAHEGILLHFEGAVRSFAGGVSTWSHIFPVRRSGQTQDLPPWCGEADADLPLDITRRMSTLLERAAAIRYHSTVPSLLPC